MSGQQWKTTTVYVLMAKMYRPQEGLKKGACNSLNIHILLFATSAVRMDRLSDASRTNQDALRGTQAEITEYRRQLQSRTVELETLRGTQDSLERQRMDSEDRHQDDLNSLQAGNE